MSSRATEPGDLRGQGKAREAISDRAMIERLHTQLDDWRIPRKDHGAAGGGVRLSTLARMRLMRNQALTVIRAQRNEISRLRRLLEEAGVDPGA